ncbi:hypothetical protein Dsin_024195 [Dipteronia sinensis]|uniref:RNase H type-1 domain-containing protein n=1 Tax=Dipteronia sinensis TaxID=43782 RepID=A0AAE0A5C4_9ROSI|nr:hypothetical protein Dsin_024195 [Dipteronia sinensis]
MNAEEVAKLCSSVSLKEREGLVRTLDVDLKEHAERKMSFCLAGKRLNVWRVARDEKNLMRLAVNLVYGYEVANDPFSKEYSGAGMARGEDVGTMVCAGRGGQGEMVREVTNMGETIPIINLERGKGIMVIGGETLIVINDKGECSNDVESLTPKEGNRGRAMMVCGCRRRQSRQRKVDMAVAGEGWLIRRKDWRWRIASLKWVLHAIWSKLVVDSVGRSCGLCLLWSTDVVVELSSFSPAHIDVCVKNQRIQWWRLTRFYSNPDPAQRFHSWNLLKRLAGMSNLPWVCLGDFSEIMEDSKKLCGQTRDLRCMLNFREIMESCELEDMGYSGDDQECKELVKSVWAGTGGFGSVSDVLTTIQVYRYGMVLSSVPVKLSIPNRGFLDAKFIGEEVRKAIFDMGPMKDNTIIGFKCMHSLKRSKRKKGLMAIKLDMSKAYDKVEWSFLKEMMKRIGFSNQWVGGIMRCVTSVSYSFLLYGELVNFTKSAMCVSPTMVRRASEELAAVVGIRLVDCHEKYLGFPCITGRHKRQLFSGIIDRDLKTFNRALLVKQCWSILKNPDYFAARILNYKYFRGLNFMDVEANSSSSFIWWSVVWGRGLLEKGMCWRIGDGSNVKIYKDCWIPKPTTFKVQSLQFLGDLSTISDLKTGSDGWCVDRIRGSFVADEAAAILSIPCANSPVPDSLLWHYKKNGCYSVKSGYHVGRIMNELPSSSGLNSIESWWKLLWSVEIPIKLNGDDVGLLCIVVWRIWFLINKRVHGEPEFSFGDVLVWSHDFLLDCQGMRDPSDGRLSAVVQSTVTWNPHNQGIYKINMDVAINSAGECVGLGMVIRDLTGFVMSASSQKNSAMYSPQVAEAIAIRQGLQFARDTGLYLVVVESDAAVVVDWIKNGVRNCSEVDLIITHICSLNPSLSSSDMSYVRRPIKWP